MSKKRLAEECHQKNVHSGTVVSEGGKGHGKELIAARVQAEKEQGNIYFDIQILFFFRALLVLVGLPYSGH